MDSIADSMYMHLTWKRLGRWAFTSGSHDANIALEDTSDSIKDKYSYWIVMLTSVTALLLEGVAPDFFTTPKNSPNERQPSVITTSLVTFKQKGGLDVVKDILRTFWTELKGLPDISEMEKSSSDDQQRMAHSYGGIKIILSLFAHLVSNKSVVESAQSSALHNRSIADFARPDYFNVHQLLVELRHSILPVAEEMWEAPEIEKASCSVVKSVVEILALVLKADGEIGAFTKRDVERKPGLKNTLSWNVMMPRQDQIRQLTEMGFSHQLATDALIRYDNVEEAAHWLSSQSEGGMGAAVGAAAGAAAGAGAITPMRPPGSQLRHPLEYGDDDENEEDNEDDDGTDIDVDAAREAEQPRDQPEQPSDQAEPPVTAIDVPSDTSNAPVVPSAAATSLLAEVNATSGEDTEMAMSVDDAPSGIVPISVGSTLPEGAPATPPAQDKGKGKEVEKPEESKVEVLTVEGLEALRTRVRDSIIDRSLDVLQVHSEITFDLADLIKCAFHGASAETRKDVASTIVQSLMSFQMDEDFRPKAKTIASTAHLLGLILQDRNFYEACMEDLTEQLSVLIGFIKIYPGEPAPWIANILLVVEKLLTENAQPRRVKFVPPGEVGSPDIIAEVTGFTVSDEDQEALFDAVIGIVPDVQKDDLLPLSVARVLVFLTRQRKLAIKMMENANLQKVFHMLRRQAGNRNDRLQTSIMLILRHVIEDDETLKTIMRSEIRAQFAIKPNRPMETNQFLKTHAHLVIRNPDIFVEVVNEMCKLTRYDPNLRNQHLALKSSEQLTLMPAQEDGKSQDGANPPEASSSGQQNERGNNETKTEDKELPVKPTVVTEFKAPGVDRPDGVIHFLLSELFACKDMQDPLPPPPESKEDSKVGEQSSGSPADVTMEDAEVAAKAESDSGSGVNVKQEKAEYKAEQHPTFLYRCFLLQSLTELLSCYNRCKVEFINFSRKANPRDPITPSKPRSAIFGYLLHDLIPIESLNVNEEIPSKKKAVVSQWAILTLVSLATQTGEVPSTDDEPDLLFVRKFVLETALKAFKDAAASTEALDTKYAKMISLSDLFSRILSVRSSGPMPAVVNPQEKSQLQIAKIMLEKNFISALTSALADVDLNFPSSRRVIKYMLKPLKLLSKMAVEMPDTSSLVTPGAMDDDEISTASSVSEDTDSLREVTPDLYRNSTLGMFEGGEMGDDDADSYDEDDEDEEMYDDEMDYEEEMDADENESELSDEGEPNTGELDVSCLSRNRI